jgi:carbamoylphosphate synthase small subunit
MLFNDAIMPAGAPNTYQTATEVSARQAQFYQRIGPFGLRLESEFLRPLIKTLVTKLQKRGMVPEFVINTNAFELVVNSAVKKGIAMSEIQRDMQLLQMVQALGPDAMMLIDMKKLAKKVLTDGDMSPDIIRTEREIAQMQEQMQQQMAQQQMMQGAQQLLNESAQSQGEEPTQG